jgi:murein DD-endopeptidase MepM/ murein hydrolase activator NlpD
MIVLKRTYFSFCFVFFYFLAYQGHSQKIIDTLSTPNGDIVLYSNRTWEYLKDKGFDGILNPGIYSSLKMMSPVEFSQSWDNQKCFTSSKGSDPSQLKDTLWLNVANEEHLSFSMPVPGVKTSPFGPRWGKNHNGVDLNLNVGDTVVAAWSGKVRYAKFNEGGFGNLVIIRHYNGLETYYAHLSKLLVQPNDEIKAGEVLGLGGNTGHSFGPHLHFEVRFFDAPINPEVYIDVLSKKLKMDKLFIHKNLFSPGTKPIEYIKPAEKQEIAKKTIPVKPKPVKKETVLYYKVKSGDNLSKIASRYGTTVSALCKLNGIKPSTSLQIGKSLRVK